MIDISKIRKYMVDNNNMTITQLAKKIGKSAPTLGRWFTLGSMPTFYAEKIAIVLSIPQNKWGKIFFNGKLPDKTLDVDDSKSA